MSFYAVLPHADRDVGATCGWDREYHTFWYVIFWRHGEGSLNDRLIDDGGTDDGDDLPTLYDLLDRTWGWISWDEERETLTQLLADPAREEQEWHDGQLREALVRAPHPDEPPDALTQAADIIALLKDIIPAPPEIPS